MSAAIVLGPSLPRKRPPESPKPPVERQPPAVLDPLVAAIASEIAQDIHEVEDILTRFGFSGSADPKWIALKDSEDFKRALGEAIREWHAADSTPKRIKYKALAAVEASMPDLFAMVVDKNLPAGGRIDAHKQLSRLAGLGESAQHGGGGGGSGFTLNINLQGEKTTITSPVIDMEPD